MDLNLSCNFYLELISSFNNIIATRNFKVFRKNTHDVQMFEYFREFI